MESNKKSVWLINQYLCTPELNGDGHRHSYLADQWIKKGYDVTLITSSFSHVPYRSNNIKGLFKVIDGDIRTVLIKGNKYSETQGVSRILSWLIFCFLLFFIPTRKIPKPDIIIVSSNSLLPILNVVFFFKKRFKKAKFILEIRDIWPLTLIELGGFSPKNIFIKFLAWVEKLGYKKADHIVSLLVNTDKHIEKVLNNRNFKYTWVSNGFDSNITKDLEPISNDMQNKIPNDFVVGYAGSLGIANAMHYIIEAIKLLKDKNVYLCIVGKGNEEQKLKKIAEGYDNIIFFDKIPKNQVQSFLSNCSILYLGIQNLPLYRYGISMNKTFDYMFAEKPILLSAPTDNIIEVANCGKVVKPDNIKMLCNNILMFKKMSEEERSNMGKRGKTHLLNHFTYEKLANDYIVIFKSFYG